MQAFITIPVDQNIPHWCASAHPVFLQFNEFKIFIFNNQARHPAPPVLSCSTSYYRHLTQNKCISCEVPEKPFT